MRFAYCPDCGAKLTEKPMGDDGPTPWCDHCKKPWFDMFSVCVISLVYNDLGEVLLLHQGYIHQTMLNLVSGYVTPGEDAEAAARREIKEETGMDVAELRPVRSFWFDRKGMLMLGFFARVSGHPCPRISQEVDTARWYPASQAPSLVHQPGSVSHTLCSLFLASRK